MNTISLCSLICVFYLYLFSVAIAQEDYHQTKIEIDSLEKLLQTQKDTTKLNTLYQLALLQKHSNPNQSKKYIKGVILNSPKTQIKLLSSSYNLFGSLLKAEGEYQQALENYLLAIPLKQQIGDKRGIASINNEIGTLYEQMKNYKQALYYYDQALRICEEIQLHVGAGMVLNNIAVIYRNDQQYDKAKNYYMLALEKGKLANSENVLITTYANLGEWYASQNQYDSSLYYSKIILEIDKKQQNKSGIILSSLNIGGVYMEKNEFSKAKLYLETALQMAFEINAKPLISNTYNSLANFYERQNQFEKAYLYRTKRQNLQDSILNESNQKEIARLREKYETEKKEQEIITLSQENLIKDLEISQAKNRERIQIGSFVFVLILAGIGVFSNQKRNQYKQKIVLAEKDNFYFAALVEAQEQERKRIAADLHDGLGQLLAVARMQVSSLEPLIELNTNPKELEEDKENYEKSVQTLDLACKEIRSVSHQMMPYALIEQGLVSAIKELTENINELENNKMKIDFITNLINIENNDYNRLNSSLEVSIFRIVQEVIGNSLKHSDASQFEISLNQETDSKNTELILLLKDNGKGFETNQITETKGLGWKNIYSRVAMAKGKIDVLGKNGMMIEIKFPL